MRPDASFMVRHPAHWIALGFGSGLSPKAPGTMGTLWAWLSWWAFQDFFSVAEQAGIIVLSSLIGIWACKITAQNLEISDPGAIVWDEVVAFWCVLLLLSPADFKTQLAAIKPPVQLSAVTILSLRAINTWASAVQSGSRRGVTMISKLQNTTAYKMPPQNHRRKYQMHRANQSL
jgi:phosphatidylglycerophosphatase A